MKIKSIKSHKKARVEIIPMIDIMFFLLATIMLASIHLSHHNLIQLNQQVNLPKGTIDEETVEKHQNINILKNNDIIFENRIVNTEELKSILEKLNKNQMLVIAADSNASHGRVIEVIDLAKFYGLKNFSIVTKK